MTKMVTAILEPFQYVFSELPAQVCGSTRSVSKLFGSFPGAYFVCHSRDDAKMKANGAHSLCESMFRSWKDL